MSKDNFLFKSKKLFLWVNLRLYYTTAQSHPENNFFDIRSKKKFLQIEESFIDSKIFSLMYTNLFLWAKENSFELTKLSLIERDFFFDRISKKCFFDSKKLLSQCIYFFSSKKKKQSRNFLESKKLFFGRIAMHKFCWFKEIFFESKKLFSGCISPLFHE